MKKEETEEDDELKVPEDEQASGEDAVPAPDSQEESDTTPRDGQAEGEADEDFEEEEEIEFDIEAQIEEFRRQIEEEPESCVHHYNLGEALIEVGELEEAKAEFDRALEYDPEKEFSAIIHFSIGNLYFNKLISGVQGTVVRSSVGLHSAHKAGDTISQVNREDYEIPIGEFESAIKYLGQLKADDDLVEYVNRNAPQNIANTYYKWASDLIDKSRQIDLYGDEIKDVKEALKHLKRTLEIDPNHSQANLMVQYAKKMLQEGWQAYDEYGFEAKRIEGIG